MSEALIQEGDQVDVVISELCSADHRRRSRPLTAALRPSADVAALLRTRTPLLSFSFLTPVCLRQDKGKVGLWSCGAPIPVSCIQLLRMLEGRDAGVVGAKVLKSMTIMKKPGSPDGNIKAIIKARDRGNSEASKQEQ